MSRRLYFAVLLFATASFAQSGPRTWTDTQGRKVEATFVRREDNTIFIRATGTGTVFSLPLDKLSAEDQKVLQTLKPEGAAAALPSTATTAEAAARIDEIVEAGLARAAEDAIGELRGAEASEAYQPFLLVARSGPFIGLDLCSEPHGRDAVAGALLPAPGQAAVAGEMKIGAPLA